MNDIESLNELLNFKVLLKNEKIKCIAVINDIFEKSFCKVLNDLQKIDANNVQSVTILVFIYSSFILHLISF